MKLVTEPPTKQQSLREEHAQLLSRMSRDELKAEIRSAYLRKNGKCPNPGLLENLTSDLTSLVTHMRTYATINAYGSNVAGAAKKLERPVSTVKNWRMAGVLTDILPSERGRRQARTLQISLSKARRLSRATHMQTDKILKSFNGKTERQIRDMLESDLAPSTRERYAKLAFISLANGNAISLLRSCKENTEKSAKSLGISARYFQYSSIALRRCFNKAKPQLKLTAELTEN